MDERLRRAAERAGAALHTLWRPAVTLALLFVAVQVTLSQSRAASTAWKRAKRLAPEPVRAAAGALGEAAVGRAAGQASAGVRAGADWVFQPLHETVARRARRGRAAGEAAVEYKRRLEQARAAAAGRHQPLVAAPVE